MQFCSRWLQNSKARLDEQRKIAMSLCSEELLKDDPAGGARSSATEAGRTRGSASLPCGTERTRGSASLPCETAENAQERVPPVRNPPLFQRDCWDRQLRTGEIYTQKWEYVRNNPVRKGLVANADGWPYQGRMNILEWHERI